MSNQKLKLTGCRLTKMYAMQTWT